MYPAFGCRLRRVIWQLMYEMYLPIVMYLLISQIYLLLLAIYSLPEDFMKSLKISDDGVVFFGAPQFE